MSNAAVSKNVGELEAHLGVRLLNRTTRKMSLTEAGSIYYERTVRLLDDLVEADDAVGELTAKPRGRIRVTAPMSWGLLRLAPIVPNFLASYPEIVVDLEFSDLRVDIVDRQFDIAIRGQGALSDSSLIARKLSDIDRVICASPDYFERAGRPEHPSDLGQHCCLIYSHSNDPDVWRLTRQSKTYAATVSGTYWVNNSLALRSALLEGTGIALIPRDYIREDLDAGRLEPILGDWKPEPQALHMIYASTSHLPSRVRLFLDYVGQRLSGTP
ncbi:MAG: DNA-binding transcriptional LysR family regulator [Alphaproteobacteria bacterium]|jgi:DNA-binding transcriptional LysR family regulator